MIGGTLRGRIGALGRSVFGHATARLFRNQMSYSGAGEDRLVIAWLSVVYGLDLSQVRYCDIGANHPRELNNTYALYRLGASGALVEPDPNMCAVLQKVRPLDTVLNVGAAFDERRSAKLTRFTSPVFNTFSKSHVDLVVESSKRWKPSQAQEIVDEIEIPLVPANEILEKHLQGRVDFMSIDAEGVDLPIVQSIDFTRFRPKIVCVEPSPNLQHFKPLFEAVGYEFISLSPDNAIFADYRNR